MDSSERFLKETPMPKSLFGQTFDDIYTLAKSLVLEAKKAMNLTTLRLDSFGLKSDVVLLVSPDDDPERIAWEIMDVLTS